jgi:hypothetical protein
VRARLLQPALTAEQISQARQLLTPTRRTASPSIARLLGVSRSTLYAHVPELSHRAGSTQPDSQRPG